MEALGAALAKVGGAMGVSGTAVGVWLFTFTFYNVGNTVLQAAYYWGCGSRAAEWKVQARRAAHAGPTAAVPWSPYLELAGVNHKPGRSRVATLLCAFNTLLAATFAGGVAEAYMRGGTRMYTEGPPLGGDFAGIAAWVGTLLWQLLYTSVHENVLEYYYHRAGHLPYFYKRFHKIHHINVAPEPFDDMLIHPLEAFLYYCILYSPPFVYNINLYSFLAYMGLMGVTGMLDHSGIRIALPGVYDVVDHDRHHEHFNVNYGFPFVWLDILHGTYDGVFWGVTYKPAYKTDMPSIPPPAPAPPAAAPATPATPVPAAPQEAASPSSSARRRSGSRRRSSSRHRWTPIVLDDAKKS